MNVDVWLWLMVGLVVVETVIVVFFGRNIDSFGEFVGMNLFGFFAWFLSTLLGMGVLEFFGYFDLQPFFSLNDFAFFDLLVASLIVPVLVLFKFFLYKLLIRGDRK